MISRLTSAHRCFTKTSTRGLLDSSAPTHGAAYKEKPRDGRMEWMMRRRLGSWKKKRAFHQGQSACPEALQSGVTAEPCTSPSQSVSPSFLLSLFRILSLSLSLQPLLRSNPKRRQNQCEWAEREEREAAGMKRWKKRRDEGGVRRETERKLQVFESPLKGELRSILHKFIFAC